MSSVDLTNGTIEELFFTQMKKMTMDARIKSFDVQFSDRWLQ